ncbi:hypothetical protein F4560_000710 [Saccharothrix ecbatanensis]|uniref:Cupin domain-containing protein n=1 Tax=Saccharothrix ecbatanensis TaxID=1105145 RepID=A0A7W9HER4_9PSEU|nr:hypothetical protein [Saccharothrix ecbatanensis]MBB5800942.1 hypothetical protein [Saccharothrix ecbatanensis]
MRGDVVVSPSGDEIVLADVGQVVLHDDALVRVWDVALEPGETHPWHLHHNPYVVLSIAGSAGRMDWLDGSEPRFLSEYRGGAVYRPVSPVHRLTNIGKSFYRNRLVELKDLGEHRTEPLDVGPGARSVEGEPAEPLPDGRVPVLLHDHVGVWTVTGGEVDLSGPHVLAALDSDEVRLHPGGPCVLAGEWFVVELRYPTAF